jgi:thiamine-monophosphate kinase
MTGELPFVAALAGGAAAAPPGETWIGDDAAVLRPPSGHLLLTVDPMVEGVHFRAGLQTAADVGWKALVRNLSDIAAMGGRPGHALVSLVIPPGCAWSLEELDEGLRSASEAFACPIVGGDVAGGATFVVTVAMTGSADAPVLRSGAHAGDALFVTGPLGGGAAGLRSGGSERFRRPVPRLGEGQAAATGGASAMLDLSDGLALDLRRLADASGVGVVVDAVPAADDATWDDAVTGGDDYELLFAAPDADRVLDAFVAAGMERPIEIGRCTGDPAERVLGDGPLPEGGWEHEW